MEGWIEGGREGGKKDRIKGVVGRRIELREGGREREKGTRMIVRGGEEEGRGLERRGEGRGGRGIGIA